MTELLLVKAKGWGFKSLWPAVVVPPSDIPHHVQVKAKGRQVVKFFNTKASDQFGIAPFKETQSFYHNVDPNVFSKKPMLFKAYTDAFEYAETNDLCKSQMDVLPEMLFIEIFSYIDWHSRVKLESVSRKWRRILSDRSLRYIDRIDLHDIVSDDCKFQQMVRSLVVDKRKLIRKITCPAVFSEDIRNMMMMSTITSDPGFLEKLNHLELVMTKDASLMSDFMSSFNMCIHLNVLKLRYSRYEAGKWYYAELDVSELVHLTELSGSMLLYRNLRAPHLSILEYCHLDLRRTDGLDGCDEFRSTIDAISANIEVLILRYVSLSRSSSYSTNTITMPKLTKLVLERDNLADITIDLQCSAKLRDLVVESANYQIINFDISLVCLALLNVGQFDDVIFDQFLASADDPAAGFSLLEGLTIQGYLEATDRLSRFLRCISPCYTYSLRYLEVFSTLCDTKILSDVDATGLVTLIDHSPHLKKILFSFNDAVIEDLIELIVTVVCLDRYVRMWVEVRGLVVSSPLSYVGRFIPDLYNALTSGVDLSVVQCRCEIQVDYPEERSPTKSLPGLIKKIKKKFRLIVSNDPT